jgi:hypothetical protein
MNSIEKSAYFNKALMVLYPQVFSIIGENAYNKDGNEIKYDLQAVIQLAENKQSEDNRHAAYVTESDPLFFKAQRGEATMEEWQVKIDEIKTRYPKQ